MLLDIHVFSISIFKRDKLIYLYIYNNNYCCLIRVPQNTKIRLKVKSAIEIYNKNLGNIIKLKCFIKQFTLCDKSKIRFAGKGYKIKKNTKNSIILLFNRSHITNIWWNNIFVKKLKKYKMYIKYLPANMQILRTIINVRPINIFTKKGLRKVRQVLLKKKGKK